jgi:hypothetical protein
VGTAYIGNSVMLDPPTAKVWWALALGDRTMKDEGKTKKQLIDELIQLRQRLSQESRHLTEAPGRTDGPEARNQDNAIRWRMEELLRASVEQWYTIFNMIRNSVLNLNNYISRLA